MNHSKLTLALFTALSISALGLTACDKPTVVNVPAETVVVPGPPGPAGAPGEPGKTGNAGETGNTGDKGVQGETGDSTTVIITPPAEPTTTN